MAQDDEIDTEALQAQIDLSMSFTHELVSSWIKSSNKPPSSYNQNLEVELKEYMRKPPRLGVGASVPESNPVTSRETARLKGQLTGKDIKRTREDEGESSNRQSSDDEGESRAGAIRKKARAGPFGGPTGKKKNPFRINAPGPSKAVDNLPLANNTAEEKKVEDGVGKTGQEDESLSMPTTSSSSESPKKKKKKRKPSSNEDANAAPANTAPTAQSATNLETAHVLAAGNSQERFSSGTVANSVSTPDSPVKAQDSRATQRLVQLVLNLDGPIGEDDSGSDDAINSPSTPKKKRKRRKKKKHQQNTTEGEAT